MKAIPLAPALRRHGLTGSCDLAIRLLTREKAWRVALLRQLAPRGWETILDVGCGTGSFALMLKRAAPEARIIGLDPDADVLKIAAAKQTGLGSRSSGSRISHAMPRIFPGASIKPSPASFSTRSPSPEGMKLSSRCLRPFAREARSTSLTTRGSPACVMRSLFRLTVQWLDGIAHTQPNADGSLEQILADTTGRLVAPSALLQTPAGVISLFQASWPEKIVTAINF